MPPLIDLIGKKFGRLIIIKRVENDQWGHSMWLCLCNCGMEKIITSHSLRDGVTRSCGCFNTEQITKRSTKHGHSLRSKMSRRYKTWAGMIQRCTNPNDKRWKDYGGRGIIVCERWLKFKNFLDDMGEAPGGLQIERIKNGLGYFKENCEWATRKQQARNKRSNRLISAFDKTQTMIEWSEETCIDWRVLQKRLNLGWTPERALTTPVKRC